MEAQVALCLYPSLCNYLALASGVGRKAPVEGDEHQAGAEELAFQLHPGNGQAMGRELRS